MANSAQVSEVSKSKAVCWACFPKPTKEQLGLSRRKEPVKLSCKICKEKLKLNPTTFNNFKAHFKNKHYPEFLQAEQERRQENLDNAKTMLVRKTLKQSLLNVKGTGYNQNTAESAMIDWIIVSKI